MYLLTNNFYSIEKQIFYAENNKIYISSDILNFKLKLNCNQYIYFDLYKSNFFIFNSLLNFFMFNNVIKYKKSLDMKIRITEYINYIFYSSTNGSIGRFRVEGRGYKVFSLCYTFLFKLGYADLIYYALPLGIKLEKKKKKINVLYC